MANDEILSTGIEDNVETASLVSASSSPSLSPKTSQQKIKLICSHGGKIVARPQDGQLKYIGGETRVVAITRDITFSELTKKLSDLAVGEMVLKYQLMPKDLEILVSVRSDEDLKHMLDEYDRQECSGGKQKMRVYLFPPNPVVAESSPSSSSREQRYIDAINGIIRAPPPLNLRTSPSSSRLSFSLSSPGTSPKVISPDTIPNPWDGSNYPGTRSQQLPMHRVRSSPILYFGGESQQQASGSQLSRHQGMNRLHHKQSHGDLYHLQHHGAIYSPHSLQPREFYRNTGRLERGSVLGPGAMDRSYPAGSRTHNFTRGLNNDDSSPIDRSDSFPYY